MNSPINILICCALMEEAKDIIESYGLREFATGTWGNTLPLSRGRLYLLITGVGRTNVASSLTRFLSAGYPIDHIVNIGSAGLYLQDDNAPQVNIGDYVYVSKSTYGDFDLTHFGYELGQTPGTSKAFYSWGPSYLGYPPLPLLTFDRFVSEVSGVNFTCLVDMEAHAIIHTVVNLGLRIKMYSLKVVSDLVGNSNQLKDYKACETREVGEHCYIMASKFINYLL